MSVRWNDIMDRTIFGAHVKFALLSTFGKLLDPSELKFSQLQT